MSYFMINGMQDHAILASDNFSQTQIYNDAFLLRNAQKN